MCRQASPSLHARELQDNAWKDLGIWSRPMDRQDLDMTPKNMPQVARAVFPRERWHEMCRSLSPEPPTYVCVPVRASWNG